MMKKIDSSNAANISNAKQIISGHKNDTIIKNGQYQIDDKVEIIGEPQEQMACYQMQPKLQKSLADSDPRLNDKEVISIMTGIKEGYKEMKFLGENVVLVVGKTGSGKSTLINYLGGVGLVGYDDDGEIKIKAKGKAITEIGQGNISETTMPARCESKDFIFWDCPGFDDNRGYKQDIMNAFYITHIVKSSAKIRICALLKYDSTKGKSNDLIEFAEQVDRLFAKENEQYKNSLSIIVTHVPEKETIANIQSRLGKMLDSAKDSLGDSLKNKDVLKGIVMSKLSIFREPKDGEELKYDGVIQIISDIKVLLVPINIDKNKLQVAPSISTKSALVAIDLYQRLNATIIDDKSTPKEKLQEAKSILKKISSEMPNVITVNDLSIVVEMNKKYFEEYADDCGGHISQYTISTTSSLKSVELVDRLNGIKFLENIVLDYAKFEPVDLYKFLKEPISDLKDKIERVLTNNDQKVIERQAQEKIQNQENAAKEYENASTTYQEKKESWSTGTKVGVVAGTTVLGGVGAVGLGAGILFSGGSVITTAASIGAVGGPVGIAVGAGIGLLIGGAITLFK